jgi:transposase
MPTPELSAPSLSLIEGAVQPLVPTADAIIIAARPTTPTAISPCCGVAAGRRQSHYSRTLADLPWQGVPVRIRLTVRRFWKGGYPSRRGDRLVHFAGQKRLNEYITPDLLTRTTRSIRFRTPTGAIAHGYEATLLADLINAALKARDAGNRGGDHRPGRCEHRLPAGPRSG